MAKLNYKEAMYFFIISEVTLNIDVSKTFIKILGNDYTDLSLKIFLHVTKIPA